MAFWAKIYGQAVLLGVFAICAAINMMAFCITCFAANEALIFHISVYNAFVVLLPFFSGGFFRK